MSWKQQSAQALVDWYASTYGEKRARRYLGRCERLGLSLPAPAERRRSGWGLVALVAALLLALAAWEQLGHIATRSLAPHHTHSEVNHERH